MFSLFIRFMTNSIYKLVAFILNMEGIDTENWPDKLVNYIK